MAQVTNVIPQGKTEAQRKADIFELMSKEVEKVATNVPAEVAEVAEMLDGLSVTEILGKGGFKFDKSKVNTITKKDGKGVIYELFTTGGYALHDLAPMKGRVLACKVAVFLK